MITGYSRKKHAFVRPLVAQAFDGGWSKGKCDGSKCWNEDYLSQTFRARYAKMDKISSGDFGWIFSVVLHKVALNLDISDEYAKELMKMQRAVLLVMAWPDQFVRNNFFIKHIFDKVLKSKAKYMEKIKKAVKKKWAKEYWINDKDSLTLASSALLDAILIGGGIPTPAAVKTILALTLTNVDRWPALKNVDLTDDNVLLDVIWETLRRYAPIGAAPFWVHNSQTGSWDHVITSMYKAYMDPTKFPNPHDFKLGRPGLNHADHKLSIGWADFALHKGMNNAPNSRACPGKKLSFQVMKAMVQEIAKGSWVVVDPNIKMNLYTPSPFALVRETSSKNRFSGSDIKKKLLVAWQKNVEAEHKAVEYLGQSINNQQGKVYSLLFDLPFFSLETLSKVRKLNLMHSSSNILRSHDVTTFYKHPDDSFVTFITPSGKIIIDGLSMTVIVLEAGETMFFSVPEIQRRLMRERSRVAYLLSWQDFLSVIHKETLRSSSACKYFHGYAEINAQRSKRQVHVFVPGECRTQSCMSVDLHVVGKLFAQTKSVPEKLNVEVHHSNSSDIETKIIVQTYDDRKLIFNDYHNKKIINFDDRGVLTSCRNPRSTGGRLYEEFSSLISSIVRESRFKGDSVYCTKNFCFKVSRMSIEHGKGHVLPKIEDCPSSSSRENPSHIDSTRNTRNKRKRTSADLVWKDVLVNDITADGPLIVGRSPLPLQLQGLFWLTDQKNQSALMSFGGPNTDGGGCSSGSLELGKDGKAHYCIHLFGDRVWSHSGDFGAKVANEHFDDFYKYVFDDASNPTFAKVEGMVGKISQIKLYYNMTLVEKGLPKYPNSVVWRRDSCFIDCEHYTILHYVVQVMDGNGRRIQPAWNMFDKFENNHEWGPQDKIFYATRKLKSLAHSPHPMLSTMSEIEDRMEHHVSRWKDIKTTLENHLSSHFKPKIEEKLVHAHVPDQITHILAHHILGDHSQSLKHLMYMLEHIEAAIPAIEEGALGLYNTIILIYLTAEF